MNSFRKTAIIVGVLFLTSTATMMLGSDELIGSILGDPDYLVNFSANENQVIIGVLLELYCAAAVAGIAILMYPILKKQNEALSLGYVGFRIIEAVLIIFISISALSLLTLSREFVIAGVPDASYFQTLGTLFLAAREWVFNIGSGLIWSLSALLLNYILYRSKLVPRWLSGWGLVGSVLSFLTYFLGFFSIHLSEWLFAPIAVQEMAFAVWLIVKGFNPITSILNLPTRNKDNRSSL
jgi:hypothetical protein